MIDLRRLLIFCVQFALVFSDATPSSPQSPMCNKLNHPCNVSTLPSNTLETTPTPENACFMEYLYRDSTECSNLKFDGKDGEFPGHMSLNTYYFTKDIIYHQTAFNLSFTNINWKSLQFRYQRVGEENINYCRKYKLSPDITVDPNFVLYHDCLMSDNKYEKFTYHLEVELDGIFRKYTFIVPHHENIDPTKLKNKNPNVEVFMYIDITDPHNIVLNFELLDDVPSYNITLVGDGNVIQNPTYTKDASRGKKDIISIPFKTPINLSPFVFKITPFGGRCGVQCTTSESPVISVAASVTISQIAAGIAIFLVIVILAALIGFFVLKMKLIKLIKKPGIAVLLDRRDIPKSAIKDPYNWFLDAFDKADAVLVFSSLQCCPSDIVGVHRRIDSVAISLLKGTVAEGNQRFASVLLPYCKKKDIPVEASKFKLFSMPAEITELVDYVKHSQGMNRLITNINMKKTENDFKLNELKTAIKDAVTLLALHEKEKPVDCNIDLKLEFKDDIDQNDMEEIQLFDDKKIGKYIPDKESENIYPNLNHLNLFGEDGNNLIPKQNRNHGEGPSSINLNELRL
ncbi:hypothetical protein B566_EDAN012802 [Ephemera danica]|nr:hypothetical protein B566_EDAN012802 [Ephemera danica]